MKVKCCYCLKECDWLRVVWTAAGEVCDECQGEYWERRNFEEEEKEQSEKK
jgi:hypothetical protein